MDSDEPTVISAIMLSDHAIREAGTNKITLIGIFSIWNSPGFPLRVPLFYITPFITNFREGGEKAITIRIENKDRHVLWSMGGKIGFAAGPVRNVAMVDAPIPVQGLTFMEAGRYRIFVIVDGSEIGFRDFNVVPLTALPPSSPQLS